MKVHLVDHKPEFKPIRVEVTIETEAELKELQRPVGYSTNIDGLASHTQAALLLAVKKLANEARCAQA